MDISSGSLYVCSTPIGNLEDITFRVLRTLGEVDLIASEDTRTTLNILDKYNIKTEQTSYHKFNRTSKEQKLLKYLKEGKNIALVSDAGTPGISDPGEELISLCIKEGINVIAVPGVSSVVTALTLSGFSTRRFIFEGFFAREGKLRRKRLKEMKHEDRTIVIYISPHRLHKDLEDILSIFGNRNVFFGRELTKKFEECWRGNVESLISYVASRDIKGEITLVLEGNNKPEPALFSEVDLKEQLKLMISGGLTGRDAVREVAHMTGTPKSYVYKTYLSMKGDIDI